MALAILLSRVLGLVRDATISYEFGLKGDRDAYVAAFALPDLLYFLVAGGALSSALIPVFTRYFSQEGKEEAWKVFSSVLCILGVIVLSFVLVTWALAEPLIALITPGLDDETKLLAANLARVLLPSQIAFFMGGLMFGTMYAQRHFSTPAMAPNIYNVGIISGVIFITPHVTPGIFGPAWGALIGAFVGSLFLPLWAMRRFGARFSISFDFAHPGVRAVFRLMLPVVFGLSLPAVYAIVIRGFGSHYGEGAISALDVGNRIMQAPLGVFGQSLALAVFPVLSSFHVQSKSREFLATVSKSTRTALYVGMIVSVLMYVLAADIVRVLNQYGKFSVDDTVFVARCVELYAIGVFAWCGHPVLVRAFFAMEDAVTPVLLGTVTSAIFVAICAGISLMDVGYEALALAVSASAILLLFLLMMGLRKKLGRADGKATVRTLFESAAVALAVGWLVWSAGRLFPVGDGAVSLFQSAARLLLLGGGGVLLYFVATKLLGMKEAGYISGALRRRPAENDPL